MVRALIVRGVLCGGCADFVKEGIVIYCYVYSRWGIALAKRGMSGNAIEEAVAA